MNMKYISNFNIGVCGVCGYKYISNLNIYVCGYKIEPLKNLMNEDDYSEIISSPYKSHEKNIMLHQNVNNKYDYKNKFDSHFYFSKYMHHNFFYPYFENGSQNKMFKIVYLGTDNVDKIYQILKNKNANSLTNSIVLTFFEKEKCIDLLKKYINNKIMNDMHPFFIFYSFGFSKKMIIVNIQNYYNSNKCRKIFQTSPYNISIIDSSSNIYYELKKKDNYYNFIEDNNIFNNSIYSINIGVYGKTKGGKSTFINKILGEKASLSNPIKPTPKTLHFKHRNYPLIFFDTEGFDEEESLNKSKKSLENKFESIKSEVHIIYFIMNFHNRLEEKERNFLRSQKSKLDRIIFIGTHAEDLHEQFKAKLLEDLKENNIFNHEYCEKIKNNIFCLDLLSDEECNIQEIKNILKRTFELCNKYYKQIKDNSKNDLAILGGSENQSIDFNKIEMERYKKGEEIILKKVNSQGIKLLNTRILELECYNIIDDFIRLYPECKEIINIEEILKEINSKYKSTLFADIMTGFSIGIGVWFPFMLINRSNFKENLTDILKKFSKIFQTKYNYEKKFLQCYGYYENSIKNCLKIIDCFRPGDTYDSTTS